MAALLELPAFGGLATWGAQFLAVWLLGLVLGWLLPKPRWVDRTLRAKAFLLSTPPGLWARRVALAAHLWLIVREVWRNLFAPGTFRAVLRNAWRTLTTGARFEWPLPDAPLALSALAGADVGAAPPGDSWYITAKDLETFKWTIDEDGGPAGSGPWEPMMEKQWPGCSYVAWRRSMPTGKAEYKSVTVSEDATAEEFMDFYLDDESRAKWDNMITETQLLETGGEPGARCQVVRWLRTFPFAFISQREYVIARRMFREPDGSLVAITRALVEHPAAPRVPGQVRMESFLSCWRSRTVPCPNGSGKPAVETTLLHFEDFRINERLARFAVRHGMAGFVKGMIPAVSAFVAERRQRCGPEEVDLASFGHRQLALAPATVAALAAAKGPSSGRCSDLSSAASLPRAASLVSTASVSLSLSSEASGFADDSASDRSGRSVGGMSRSSSMRRLGAMMLASGVAIALARTASTGSLPPASPGAGSRGGYGNHGHSHGKRQGGSGHGQASNGRHHAHHSSGHRRHGQPGGAAGEVPPRPRRRQQPVEPSGMA